MLLQTWMYIYIYTCLGYCKQCCNEHLGCMCIFNLDFSLDICPGVGMQAHMVILHVVF